MGWFVHVMLTLLAGEAEIAVEATTCLNSSFEGENDSGRVRNVEPVQKIPRGEHHGMD